MKGKYIKITTFIGEHVYIKVTKMFLDYLGEPYKCYCTRLKIEPKAYFYEDDIVYLDEEKTKYENISEEEYNEAVNQFINKLIELK